MLNLMTFLAILAAPAVQAAPAERAPSVLVAHADLDLTRPAGRAKLDRRIARAVDQVCPDKEPGEIARTLAAARCRAETRARVAPQRSRVVAQASAPGQLSSAAR